MNKKYVILAVVITVAVTLFAWDFDIYFPPVFDKVKDSVVVITGDMGSGTGFIVEMDGATWLMTNEHVVSGQGRIKASTLSGKRIIPTDRVDIAINRDLIRYKIEGGYKALKWRSSELAMNEPVWVFGNSDGSGVVTSISGYIIGLGPDKIEVSARFVSGNSGSPVVDKNGDVVGVATFAESKRNYTDWAKVGTRFNEVRRFAETIGGVEWEPFGYQQYLDDCSVLSSCLHQCVGFMEVTERIGSTSNSKPTPKRAKSIGAKHLSVINKDKKSKRVYEAIVAADDAYEKAVKAYKITQEKVYRDYGILGQPTEVTLRRRQKDIDKAYNSMLQCRKKGLLRAKALAEECIVKSVRSKADIKRTRELIDEAIADFDRMYMGCVQK